MKTQKILSIIAITLLGLSFLCALIRPLLGEGRISAFMDVLSLEKAMKEKKSKNICSILVFVAVVLIAVSQLLMESADGFEDSCAEAGRPCGKGTKCCGAPDKAICIFDPNNPQRGPVCKKIGI